MSIGKRVAASFMPSASSKGLRFETHFLQAELEVFADADKITEVFTNLLGNAVKFTEHEMIGLGIEQRPDGEIECWVSDTGPGIAEEDKARLFKKFEQLGHKASAGEKGTGLGLAISKHLVELHGGRI